MPGTKQRTVRRKKICPPHKRIPQKSTNKPSATPTETRSTPSQDTLSSTPSRNTSTSHSQNPPQTPSTSASHSQDPPQTPSTSTRAVSASRKKLSKSPHTPLSNVSSDSDDDLVEAGNKLVILEVDGINEALQSSVVCKECSGGPVVFVEDHTSKQGMFTKPSLHCKQCGVTTNISFSTFPPSYKALTINRKSVFTNKCIGGTSTSLNSLETVSQRVIPGKNGCRNSLYSVQV